MFVVVAPTVADVAAGFAVLAATTTPVAPPSPGAAFLVLPTGVMAVLVAAPHAPSCPQHDMAVALAVLCGRQKFTAQITRFLGQGCNS